MEIFSYSLDLTRLVYLIGAVFAVLYKRRTGITPGGIIVPPYLAILLDHSVGWFIGSLLVVAGTYFIFQITMASRALSKHWVVFANIAISAVIVLLLKYIVFSNSSVSEVFAFGFAVPGLIAANARRYGLKRVTFGALATTAVTLLAGYALAFVLPFKATTALSTQLASYDYLSIVHPFVIIPIALISSLFISYRYSIRTGGYVLAPYVAALFLGSWLQFIAFVISCVFGYVVVQSFLKYSLVVGIERFVVCMFTSMLLVTTTDVIAVHYGVTSYRTSSMVVIIAMGVIINDLCLQRAKLKAVAGIAAPVIITMLAGLAVR